MKLKTAELKQFNSIAGCMQQNKLLPILSYLKFDKGKITKNNLESFICMDADFEGSCLIDEKKLMEFVNSINASEVNVEINGTSITLSNPNNAKEKVKLPTTDIDLFPETLVSDGVETELNNEVLKAVKVALNFTMERDNMPQTTSVYIGQGLVGAATGFIAYMGSVSSELPEIVMDKTAAFFIKNFDTVLFSENERCQFYSNHVFKFGFIKKEIPYLNMNPWIALMPKDVEGVEVEKDEIIKFCDFCVNTSEGRVVVAQILGDKLTMAESGYEVEYEKPISAKLEHFTFNPAIMSKLLKSIPDEKVNFIRAKGKYYVTGNGFVSLIMEMQFQST